MSLHVFILFLKISALVKLFSSEGTIHPILGPKKEIISLPWATDIRFGTLNCQVQE